jgi:hypothetical protein
MSTATINSRVITSFLDELSASHADVDFDIDIIQGLVDGWVRAGDKVAIAEFKQKLFRVVTNIPD